MGNAQQTSDTVDMTIKLTVTEPQAIALQQMFEHWNHLSSVGGNQNVAFFIDGNWGFNAKCEMTFSKKLKKTKSPATKSTLEPALIFDYNNIAMELCQ